MIKTVKVIGIVNILLIAAMIGFTINFVVQIAAYNDGWASLGFIILGIFFLLISILLSIPFVIFTKKLGFMTVPLYSYSHVALLVMNVLVLLTGYLLK